MFVEGNLTETDNSSSKSDSESSSSESALQVQSFQTMKRDLLLVKKKLPLTVNPFTKTSADQAFLP